MNKTKVELYVLLLLGFYLILVYVWYLLIRERLPQEYQNTPFTDSERLNPEPIRQYVKDIVQSWDDERKGFAYQTTQGVIGSKNSTNLDKDDLWTP